jgi:hypothetical protein
LDHIMRITRRTAGFVGLGGAALLAAAVSTGVASAATGSTSPVIHRVASVSTAAAPSTAKAATEKPGTEVADGTEKPGTEVADGTEKPGTEVPDGTEKPGTETAGNDGPGGHADPAGAVDHQFEGNE